MKLAAFLLALPLMAQTPPIPLPAPTNLPKVLITGGGGWASPSGSFAYISESTLVLPQSTYATLAQEYTLIKGNVQSCTLAGLTKPLYQFSVITIGLTGLGGGCASTSGSSGASGEGQGFAHFRWGKLPLGTVITVMKNSNSAFKITVGFSWGTYP